MDLSEVYNGGTGALIDSTAGDAFWANAKAGVDSYRSSQLVAKGAPDQSWSQTLFNVYPGAANTYNGGSTLVATSFINSDAMFNYELNTDTEFDLGGSAESIGVSYYDTDSNMGANPDWILPGIPPYF